MLRSVLTFSFFFQLVISPTLLLSCEDFNLYTDIENSPLLEIPIEDQGEFGICYAISAAHMVNYYQMKSGKQKCGQLGSTWVVNSYKATNPYDVIWDAGFSLEAGYITNAIDSLKTMGICSEKTVKRNIQKAAEQADLSENQMIELIDKVYYNYYANLSENFFTDSTYQDLLKDSIEQSLKKIRLADLEIEDLKVAQFSLPKKDLYNQAIKALKEKNRSELASLQKKLKEHEDLRAATQKENKQIRENKTECELNQLLEVFNPLLAGNAYTPNTMLSLLLKGCEEKENLCFENIPNTSVSPVDNGHKKFQNALEHLLSKDSPYPVGIGFDSSLFEPDHLDERPHAALLVGKRKKYGECQYLLRNSWGVDWRPTSSEGCLCRLGDEIKDCSEFEENNPEAQNLGCWLKGRDLANYTYDLTKVDT